MIRGVATMFANSYLKITVPVMVLVVSIVVLVTLDTDIASSMQASSWIAYAALVWIPMVVFMAYLDSRSFALTRFDDPIPFHNSVSRLHRVSTVMLAQLLWLWLGWAAIWLGGAVALNQRNVSVLWIMLLNGWALISIAIAVASVLAATRLPAWSVIAVAGLSYVLLAVWLYLPSSSVSILFSTYGTQFFVEALPNFSYLIIQMLWALAALVLVVLWISRKLTTIVLAIAVISIASVTIGIASVIPYVEPRATQLQLLCEPFRDTEICVWEDQISAREPIQKGIEQASGIMGSEVGLPQRFVQSDYLEQTLGSTDVVVPLHISPSPRSITALTVAEAIDMNPMCPDLRFADMPNIPVPDVVAVVVESGFAPWSQDIHNESKSLSDSELASWYRLVVRHVDECEAPVLP